MRNSMLVPPAVMLLTLGALLFSTSAAAVTIFECEDDVDGSLSFQQSCPPGTRVVSEKNVYTGPHSAKPDLDEAAAAAPIVLYSAPACDACDVVRSLISQRGIPFTEKDVSNDIDLQEELLDRTGQLSVPVTMIGEKIVSGYNRTGLESELSAAGYPD